MNGILMRPELHQAIRDLRKTQTRRSMKPQPNLTISDEQFKANLELISMAHPILGQRYSVGEIVYIKEAWQIYCYKYLDHATIRYALDGAVKRFEWDEWLTRNTVFGAGGDTIWHSPMFLRETFARSFIKILSVAPQRLQEITDEDAMAEGITVRAIAAPGGFFPSDYRSGTYRYGYAQLWDSINKEYKWESNPYVWKYCFELALKEGE